MPPDFFGAVPCGQGLIERGALERFSASVPTDIPLTCLGGAYLYAHQGPLPQGRKTMGEFRIATHQDLEQVVDGLSAFGAESGLCTRDQRDPVEIAPVLIEEGRVGLWCVCGEMVALCYESVLGETLCLSGVYTLPHHRGQGYGAALVLEMTRRAKARGLTPVVYADMAYPPSNALYGSLGYTRVGELVMVGWERKEEA